LSAHVLKTPHCAKAMDGRRTKSAANNNATTEAFFFTPCSPC